MRSLPAVERKSEGALGRLVNVLDLPSHFLLRLGAFRVEAKLRKEINEQAKAVAAAPLSAEQWPTKQQLEAAERVGQIALQTDISVVRQQLSDAAREYERLRATMPSGEERTLRMEVIVAKMRTLAIAGYPLLKEFAESSSSGDRLAAVVMLQMWPSPDYIRWLRERVSEERAFIGYHAAIALFAAARVLEAKHQTTIREAIAAAKQAVGTGEDTEGP